MFSRFSSRVWRPATSAKETFQLAYKVIQKGSKQTLEREPTCNALVLYLSKSNNISD